MSKRGFRDRDFEKQKILRPTIIELESHLVDKNGDFFFCCICGNKIMGHTKKDWPHRFHLDRVNDADGHPFNLYSHGGWCLGAVTEAGALGRWKVLPKDSPLRKLFEQAAAEAKRIHDQGGTIPAPPNPTDSIFGKDPQLTEKEQEIVSEIMDAESDE